MILSGNQIVLERERKRIHITPFDPKQVNPASYDLTLGDSYIEYHGQLDSRKRNDGYSNFIRPSGVLIQPGTLHLMHTRERINTDHFVGVVDGKSSIGRLGIQVHLTAGYIDPGFDGQVTLEVICVHPVRIYAGMRIAQIRFEPILGDVTLYEGHYRGPTAEGAIASRSWEQFE